MIETLILLLGLTYLLAGLVCLRFIRLLVGVNPMHQALGVHRSSLGYASVRVFFILFWPVVLWWFPND